MKVNGIEIRDEVLKGMQSSGGSKILLHIEAIIDSYRRRSIENGMSIATNYETTVMEKGGSYYLGLVLKDLDRIRNYEEGKEDEGEAEFDSLPLVDEFEMDEVI